MGSVPAMASAIALCTRRMHARTCTHTHTRSTHTRIHARATRAHTHTARPLRPAVALPLLRLTRRGGWAGADAMQALGAGEYFAENPQISIPYCAGGKRMLVFAVLMVPQAARLGTHSARDQPEISPREEAQPPTFSPAHPSPLYPTPPHVVSGMQSRPRRTRAASPSARAASSSSTARRTSCPCSLSHLSRSWPAATDSAAYRPACRRRWPLALRAPPA